ncbi:uncharacterized protein LOC143222185 [Tachypleus tridentatus]|uniref:uncharacterized protein LOC143222185 n=1 Tax=Tachypleus tridentatus TaxID=6853 RepID=UPI003FD06348
MNFWEVVILMVWAVLIPFCVCEEETLDLNSTDDGHLPNTLLLPGIVSRHAVLPDNFFSSKWVSPFTKEFLHFYLVKLLQNLEENKRNKIYQERLKSQVKDGGKRGNSILHFGKRHLADKEERYYKRDYFQPSPKQNITFNSLKYLLDHSNQQDRKRNVVHKMLYFVKQSIMSPKDKDFTYFIHNSPDNTLYRKNKIQALLGSLVNKNQHEGNNRMSFDKYLGVKKRPDHQIMCIGKRLDKEKQLHHHIKYFSKRSFSEKRPQHQKKYSGKKINEENVQDHQMTYIKQHNNIEKQPFHRIMYFPKISVEELQPDHSIMNFNKGFSDEERSTHQVMYFGKIFKVGKRPNHYMIHFGKRSEDEKQQNHHMMYYEKRTNDKEQPDYEIVSLGKELDKRNQLDHHLTYGVKRSENEKRKTPRIMHFGKNNDDEKQPSYHILYFVKRCYSEKRPDHNMMYFGKRSAEKSELNHNIMFLGKRSEKEDGLYHHMMYFGKRFEKEKRPNHHMMYFGKRSEEEKQPARHMMYLSKRSEKEKRPDHHIMYFGKRVEEDKRPDHHIMYFGKKSEEKKRAGYHVMYFGKSSEEVKQPDHHMMYFGKRSDEEKQPANHLMYFGKRPDHHMMYFGKRSEEEEKERNHKTKTFMGKNVNKVNDRLRLWPGDLVGNNYERDYHNIISFGKRTQKYDNQEPPISSLLNLYNDTNTPLSEKYGLNYYDTVNPVLSFSNNENSLFHKMDKPSLMSENMVGKETQKSDKTVIIPLVIKSAKGQKLIEESKLPIANHFEKRSLKNKETKGVQYIKIYDSEELSSKKMNSSVYSSSFSFKKKIKPKINSKNDKQIISVLNQKPMGHNEVKRSISASGEPIIDVAKDFASYSGYVIIPDNKDEGSVSKRWSFENPHLFSFYSVESLEPVISEQFQNRYPNSQYYIREDRNANTKNEEQNAFLHFG